MNPERRPLLMDAEVQGKSARPRPDLRNSPDSVLVDVKSGDEGEHFFIHLFMRKFGTVLLVLQSLRKLFISLLNDIMNA